jgi:glycosyltransferase involved in cell wall biosynthesis
MSRVALLAPFAFPSVRGNAVTVARIVAGLRERGVGHRVWDVSAVAEALLERQVEEYRPGIVHAFHALRAGPLGLRLARRAEIPLVVTLTGTDANHDLFDPDRAAAVRRVLEGATVITAFHGSLAERVAASLPDVRSRLVIVPQSFRFGAEPFDLAVHWALPPGAILFLFAGGIRPVKQPLVPLLALDRVARANPALRLLYVGPILDDADGAALTRELASRPWARHIGAVPHAQIASLIARADVVLNCSISEGGMANSVLEALALGRAVLASDIEGNRTLIEHEVTGLLFRQAAELATAAERLMRDPALRRRLGAAGRALVDKRYPPAREIDGYLAVYGRLAPVPSS